MHVRAVSIGHAVPGADFDAVVHSVFDSALNIQPNEQEGLITVLRFEEADLPQGIRLERSSGFSFKALPRGTEATSRSGILRFSGGPLTIDLRQAACWDKELPTPPAEMRSPPVIAAWQSAWEALNDRQALHAPGLMARDLFSPAETVPAWVQQAGRGIRSLTEATQRRSRIPGRALRGLIGLGPGLTPGGDDLLAGYLVGLRYATQGKQERLDFASRLGEAVARLSTHTGDISRTALLHAARGRASSRLHDLAGAICSGSARGEILACAEAAMQVGHTSGMDAVSGLLIGLAVWDAPQLLAGAETA